MAVFFESRKSKENFAPLHCNDLLSDVNQRLRNGNRSIIREFLSDHRLHLSRCSRLMRALDQTIRDRTNSLSLIGNLCARLGENLHNKLEWAASKPRKCKATHSESRKGNFNELEHCCRSTFHVNDSIGRKSNNECYHEILKRLMERECDKISLEALATTFQEKKKRNWNLSQNVFLWRRRL